MLQNLPAYLIVRSKVDNIKLIMLCYEKHNVLWLGKNNGNFNI